ncbi:hypothetical protein [Pontibacter fetidus]|uniref:Uncharacterized protein n=1 Tax=Pontibacter fetidus TaxID=2700082 RepID=A0A6B2HBR2_9BACT|nr:hypothetical protein [Pontibacter fetidus]NDK57382.1 hypothetical protein [Pontibacter fetidus]
MDTEQEIRLGKIYNGFPGEGVKVELLDCLSVEQFQEFEFSISVIDELHDIIRLMSFVAINGDEVIDHLYSSLHDFIIKSASLDGVKQEDGDKAFLNTNRLFLNYLSSIRTFLDHSETFLKRKYGAGSSQFLEFKKMISFYFDNSFAYRFFYKLRNYAQHISLPIDSFQFSSKYNQENNKLNGTITAAFNRNKLLANYDSWGTVKKDLVKEDAEFDITPLIVEMTSNIQEIERNIELLHKDELVKASTFISKLTDHLRNDNAEIFIAHKFKAKKNGELLSYQSIHIPFNTIEFIQSRLIS